jgi:hypothetical protein
MVTKSGVFMESRKSLFVVIRRYGPPYDPQKPLEAQLDWEGHRLFMNALEAEGLARLAGPLEGTTEVLLVFRADSENEIDERGSRSGPAVTACQRYFENCSFSRDVMRQSSRAVLRQRSNGVRSCLRG